MLTGRTFKRRRQQYTCLVKREHVTRDHRWVCMIELSTECVECGRPFHTSAAMRQLIPRQVTR